VHPTAARKIESGQGTSSGSPSLAADREGAGRRLEAAPTRRREVGGGHHRHGQSGRAARENGCSTSASARWPTTAAESPTGFGFSVGRSPTISISPRRRRQAADRATGLLGATKPSSRRLTVVLDPFVTAQFLGVISSTLNGEAVIKGRSLFKDRVGETVASAAVHARRRPTNPLAYTATDVDGEGLAARRNVLIDHGVLQGFVHSPARPPAGREPSAPVTRSGGGWHTGCGVPGIAVAAGRSASQAEMIAESSDGVLGPAGVRACTAVSTRSAATSRRVPPAG
jgi:PmbA protein